MHQRHPLAGAGCFGGIAMSLHIVTCTAATVAPYLEDLARLRAAELRDWPYLYEGDPSHGFDYLDPYLRSSRSVFVFALDGSAVIGASVGIPLAEHGEVFQQPFRESGMVVDEIYHLGQSMLQREYRGLGLGHRFFDEREAHTRRLGGFRWTAFCAVERRANDLRRPTGHRSGDLFWQGRGYRRMHDLCSSLSWPEAGADTPTPHRLQFWVRPLIYDEEQP
jgi:GNAT superfamily N-acetyltransferase